MACVKLLLLTGCRAARTGTEAALLWCRQPEHRRHNATGTEPAYTAVALPHRGV